MTLSQRRVNPNGQRFKPTCKVIFAKGQYELTTAVYRYIFKISFLKYDVMWYCHRGNVILWSKGNVD